MESGKHSPFSIFLLLVTYLRSLFDLWYTIIALDTVGTARKVNLIMECTS